MQLFDSHCHLDDKSFDRDRKAVMQRASQGGVYEWMAVGVDKETSLRALEVAQMHNGGYASVGVHPHFAASCCDDTLRFLKTLSQHAKVRAWGETGLDFNRMRSPRKEQEKWFVNQLHAADELNLPLIFHERDSHGRFLDILCSYPHTGRQGVVHCFSGSHAELRSYLDLGFYIGVTGIVTLKSRGAGLRRLIKYIPEDRLLIETDAPWLTPVPQKNDRRRNEPAFVVSVLSELALILGNDLESLAAVTRNNARRLFHIV